jgi:hypothetical protein
MYYENLITCWHIRVLGIEIFIFKTRNPIFRRLSWGLEADGVFCFVTPWGLFYPWWGQ